MHQHKHTIHTFIPQHLSLEDVLTSTQYTHLRRFLCVDCCFGTVGFHTGDTNCGYSDIQIAQLTLTADRQIMQLTLPAGKSAKCNNGDNRLQQAVPMLLAMWTVGVTYSKMMVTRAIYIVDNFMYFV